MRTCLCRNYKQLKSNKPFKIFVIQFEPSSDSRYIAYMLYNIFVPPFDLCKLCFVLFSHIVVHNVEDEQKAAKMLGGKWVLNVYIIVHSVSINRFIDLV